MRISDWSSDVCSSDLAGRAALRFDQSGGPRQAGFVHVAQGHGAAAAGHLEGEGAADARTGAGDGANAPGKGLHGRSSWAESHAGTVFRICLIVVYTEVPCRGDGQTPHRLCNTFNPLLHSNTP